MNVHDYHRTEPSLLAHLWYSIKRGLARDNSRDTKAQAVRVSNQELRMAQARRIKRQPGLTAEQQEHALRMLGRVGRGS